MDSSDSVEGLPGIDSVNQWPVLSDPSSSPPRTELWATQYTLFASVEGALYKLTNVTAGLSKSGEIADGEGGAGLFDVLVDPSETVDLSDLLPGVRSRMKYRLDELAPTLFQLETNVSTETQMLDLLKAACDEAGGFLVPLDCATCSAQGNSPVWVVPLAAVLLGAVTSVLVLALIHVWAPATNIVWRSYWQPV